MKRPSWTSRILSENASSSLCFKIFTSDSFVAFDGRHLSKSSIGEVSEITVKFVAPSLKQWKRNNGEICRKCYSLLYIRYGMSKKGKTNPERSSQSFSFILKTDYLHLTTGCNDECACLWKQLKCNKFPFYGDRLSGNIYHGINIADSVSEKIT